MISDETLVKRTLENGSHHFGELVNRYADYLFGLGMRLTAGNKSFSEEIAQRTFVRAYRYLASFDRGHQPKVADSDHRFRNWLTGIAANCFRDLIRTEQQYVSLEGINEPDYAASSSDLSAFNELVKPLSAEDRMLFVLRYIYEYSIAEIAGLTNINEGTVKSRVSRAMSRLREVHHA
jgi:RNA polymerase sigma-70 factor (ECF subfamily)